MLQIPFKRFLLVNCRVSLASLPKPKPNAVESYPMKNPFNSKIDGLILVLVLFSIYLLSSSSAVAQMVAQYGFEGNVLDTSGNGINGTNHTVSFTTSAAIGTQAGVFNGTSSYVDLNNGSLTGPLKPALPVTISAWVYLNSTTGRQCVFSSDNTDNISVMAGYDLSIVSGALTCDFGDGGSGTSHIETKTGNSVMTTGQWYHVAAVIVGASNMHLYINGGDDGGTYSGSGGTMAYTTTSSKIGTSNTANFFDGAIDDVQVYNTALTDTKIELLAYGGLGSWAFSEGAGTTTADATGNGFTGTLVNGPTWTTGKVGNALSFNGTDSYVNMNNTSATSPLKPSLPITVGAWVKLNSTSGVQRIISGDNSDNTETSVIAGYDLSVVSGNLVAEFGDAQGPFSTHRQSKSGTTVLATGTWYYLSAVIEGASNIHLYVNGVDDGGAYSGTGGTMAYTDASSKIGTSGTSNFLNGTVEDVCVYNYAFSPAQISVLYSAQPSAPTLPTSFGDNFDDDATDALPPAFGVSSNINTGGGGVNEWSVVNESGTNNVYQAVLTNAPGNGSGSATSIAGVPYLGGGINRNFTYSTNLKVVSAPSQYNIGIVALSGAESDLSGDYYRAGVNQSGSVFLQSSNGRTTGLTLGTATNLPGGLVVGTNYTFTITGTYSDSTLTLAFTVTDGTHTGSLSATTTTPLTGNYCGYDYEVVTIGGSLTVQADNFNTAIHFGTWTPVFDDEFTGTSLNTSLWSTGYRWTGVINNELEAMRPENVTVANGVCTIKTEQRTAENANMFNYSPDAVMSYASGCIQTFTKFRQQNGYYEARIKMPSATGCWPGFWMLPDRDGGALTQTGDALDERVAVGDTVDGVSIPMGNEIDAVEYQSIWENPSTGASASHCGYIWSYGPPVLASATYAQTANGFGPTLSLDYPDSQFHTYGVHWFPGGYVFYVDGKAVFNGTSSTNASVAPEYLLLDCALTTVNWRGTNATLDQINAALPGYMQIDYVRSWSEGP